MTEGMENAVVESTAPDTTTEAVSEKNEASTPAQNESEEMLEIALGNVKGKVPKAMAQAIKEFERGSREKFQKSAQTEKQLQNLVQSLKANPKAVLSQLGIDPHEFAEMTLAEKLAELQKSPEQRELDELRSFKKQQEEAIEAQRKQMEAQEFSKREQTAMQSLDSEIAKAFAESGLPKRPTFIRMIAGDMRAAALRGEDLTARDAASKIKQDLQSDFRGLLENLEPDAALREYLGEETFKKLREYDVKRITGHAAPTPNSGPLSRTTPNGVQSTRRKGTETPLNERSWREYQESLKS